MITEMQERVALEIYRSMTRDMSESPLLTPIYYNAAWAAINAMREPTYDMQKAWERDFTNWLNHDIEDDDHLYKVMVDAALSEESE